MISSKLLMILGEIQAPVELFTGILRPCLPVVVNAYNGPFATFIITLTAAICTLFMKRILPELCSAFLLIVLKVK